MNRRSAFAQPGQSAAVNEDLAIKKQKELKVTLLYGESLIPISQHCKVLRSTYFQESAC